MAAPLLCPRCGASKSWLLKDGRRRCAACRHDWTPGRLPLRLSPQEWRAILEWFVRGASSAEIARETGLDRKRVLRALMTVREAILRSAARQPRRGLLPSGWARANLPGKPISGGKPAASEAFSAYLQRQLSATRGIRRNRRDLYLAAFTWRYNHQKLAPAEQVRQLLELIRAHQ